MQLGPDPVEQFRAWLDEARAGGEKEPNALTLATASPEGVPSARMVILRGLDERGFVFYTSSFGQKSRDLDHNPRAALVFYWVAVGRQVRITGPVSLVSRQESDRYFASRPYGARLAAWAAPQSQVISDRAVLEARVRELAQQYPTENVPVPPDWIGYRVAPETIEFWQSDPNRLHDRLRYTRQAAGGWLVERLAP